MIDFNIKKKRNQHGTLLTNFDEDRLELYQEAIKVYEKTIQKDSRYTLKIASGWSNYTKYGLYYIRSSKDGTDCAPFWNIVENLRGEINEFTYI